MDSSVLKTIVRHEDANTREKSTCGYRYRLIPASEEGVGANLHVVDIEGAKEHFHKETIEIYYVLEAEADAAIVLDGVEHPLKRGSVVHIPPGVVHGGKGRMRVLVAGIPKICDEDLFFPDAG